MTRRIERPSGLALLLDDDAPDVADAPDAPDAPRTRAAGIPATAPGLAGRGGRLPSGPVAIPADGAVGGGPEEPDALAAPPEAVDDPVVRALQTQGFAVVDAVELPMRRRGDPSGGTEALSVAVPEGEDAVVLLEQDGVYAWRFADAARTTRSPARRDGPRLLPATRQLVFDLTTPESPGAVGAGDDPLRQRGRIRDVLFGRVRAFVLRFVARVAVEQLLRVLERDVARGLVVVAPDAPPERWRRIETMAALTLPADRPARILLLVHGTFSSTAGSYGALAASPWGRDFLAAAARDYDVVLGFDHATLADDPLENAVDLLGRLEQGAPALAPQVDAVAFSRGALVLRTLVEQLLPQSPLGPCVRRAVFVGSTNGGTALADPANWERLADLTVNLAAAGSRALGLVGGPAALVGAVLAESIRAIGALVKYMARAAVTERHAPGLAAMEPGGPYVTTLNLPQEGQPGPADAVYCTVSSEFDLSFGDREAAPEFPERLKKWLLDGAADALMREPNDLVVPVASMTAIDDDAAAFVDDRLELGRNPHVYHTVYFTRPEVVAALSRWLGLDGTVATAAGRAATRGGRRAPAPTADARTLAERTGTRLLVVAATAPYAEVRQAIDEERPTHVVVERGDPAAPARYAYAADEIAASGPASAPTTRSPPCRSATRWRATRSWRCTSGASRPSSRPARRPWTPLPSRRSHAAAPSCSTTPGGRRRC